MSTKVKKRSFDCVDFKRQAQSRIYRHIKSLSPQQEIDYFRTTAEGGKLGQWWKQVKAASFDRQLEEGYRETAKEDLRMVNE